VKHIVHHMINAPLQQAQNT